MSGTRLPLRTGQVIEFGGKKPALLIAAHGNIGGLANNATLFALADTVGARLAGLPVACGVLNGAPAIETVIARFAGQRMLLYPLFMSGGYYLQEALPARLGVGTKGDAGGREVTILSPLGLDPALPALIARRVREAAPANPYSVARTKVLVIAHGSSKSPQSRIAAETFADGLRKCLKTMSVRTAYLEETPFAEDAVAALCARSVVINFFAGEGRHGGADVADFLSNAGKDYVPVIGPVGADPKIADIVVAAVRRELPRVLRAA